MPMLSLLIALSSSTSPQMSDVQGAWVCGPYEMEGTEMVISAVDRPNYSPDGSFSESASATYTLPDNTEIRVETRHVGAWSLVGDIIEIRYSSAEFLASDSPILTKAAGQATLDARMQRKGWTQKRILDFNRKKLVTVPAETDDKRAQVRVSCSRA